MEKKEEIRGVAFELALQEGWQVVSFQSLSERSGLSESEIREHFASTDEIFLSLVGYIDESTLQNTCNSEDPVRDRIFDIIMARFDNLTPYKREIKIILDYYKQRPIILAKLFNKVMASMKLMLTAAEVPLTGLQGKLKIKGITLIYANVFRVWLNDETQDMSLTMATLDSNLRNVEPISSLFHRKRGGEQPSDTAFDQ